MILHLLYMDVDRRNFTAVYDLIVSKGLVEKVWLV